MKLKPHSIRFKFFSAISLVALMFIGILLLLNLFFYQDYFMMTRKSSLCDAFDTVCGSYDGDMDDIVTLLDSYESRSAIRLAVAMDDGTVLTSSFLHDRDDHAAPDFEFGMNEQQFRSIAVLASVMQNEDWSSTRTRAATLSPICRSRSSSRIPRSTWCSCSSPAAVRCSSVSASRFSSRASLRARSSPWRRSPTV